MSKIDASNNELSGVSGSDEFLGSNNSFSLGSCDLSSASFLKIPSSASPSLSLQGQISLDTSVSGYPGVMKYYSGSEEMSMIPILSSDLSAITDGQVLGYSLGQSKVVGVNQSGADKISQFIQFTDNVNHLTDSLSPAAIGFSGTITPNNASNDIVVTLSGSITSQADASIAFRYGGVSIFGSTGTLTELSEAVLGFRMSTSSSLARPITLPFLIRWKESAGSTILHTYDIRLKTGVSQNETILNGATYPTTLTIIEQEP